MGLTVFSVAFFAAAGSGAGFFGGCVERRASAPEARKEPHARGAAAAQAGRVRRRSAAGRKAEALNPRSLRTMAAAARSSQARSRPRTRTTVCRRGCREEFRPAAGKLDRLCSFLSVMALRGCRSLPCAEQPRPALRSWTGFHAAPLHCASAPGRSALSSLPCAQGRGRLVISAARVAGVEIPNQKRLETALT